MPEPAGHIGPDFREHFPTWQHLRGFIAEHARHPEYSPGRAMHQLVMADLMSQMNTGTGDWHLLGSLALPMRPRPADPWPTDFQPTAHDVHPSYCMPRTAFDLDLFAFHLRQHTASDYGRDVVTAVHAAAPPVPREPGAGLAGLVRYSANQLHVHDSGQVMGTVNAQPVDDRYGTADLRPVDDPLIIEIDIKPPSKIQFSGPPEPSYRSVVGLEVPGVQPIRPSLYPLANQLADKIVLLTGPPASLRETSMEPWHRYKDLVDLHFIVKTCRVDGDMLRHAIVNNWNWNRFDATHLPTPYRVYGQDPVPPTERAVPWQAGIDELRKQWPQLQKYPGFSEMIESVGRFAAGLDNRSNRMWLPARGWSNSPVTVRPTSAAIAAQQVFRRPGPSSAPPLPRSTQPTPPPRGPAPQRRESGRGRRQS
jgi:hypothetical protein